MLNREEYLKQIIQDLALLSKEIELRSTVNLYDINIIAEDFYADLLNLIYGYKLKNVNILDKNAPAIDLADEENRVSIQVTSDNTSTKIKHTLSEFIEHEKYKQYDRLIVLILTNKKSYTTQFETQGKLDFNKEKDIIDLSDLTQIIREKNSTTLKQISEFLQRELHEQSIRNKATEASEVETIIDLIEYITKHRKLGKKRESVVDPEYKIYKRFKEFTDSLISEYTTLYMLYGEAIDTVHHMLQIDEVQEIIMVLYLQDISIQYLDQYNNNPVEALNGLVAYLDNKLSSNGKRYDRAAIKFYIVNEMIKCNVFPNERDEYNASK